MYNVYAPGNSRYSLPSLFNLFLFILYKKESAHINIYHYFDPWFLMAFK